MPDKCIHGACLQPGYDKIVPSGGYQPDFKSFGVHLPFD
jgi:hypothetical protein